MALNWRSKKNYGRAISRIGVVISCLEREVEPQRKRFQKATKVFTYDIILDYLLIVATESKDEKKRIIKRQVVEVSEQTFSKYKFDGFDKEAFLRDLKETMNSIEWWRLLLIEISLSPLMMVVMSFASWVIVDDGIVADADTP